MNESGFRSYFREHAPDFTLLEPLLTFESSAIAQEMTEKLLNENPDLSAFMSPAAALPAPLPPCAPPAVPAASSSSATS